MDMYEKIKKLRIEQGLSQDELADKVGYTHRSSIGKVESGLVDLPQSKIKAFADALHTTPQYLMGYDEKSEKQDVNKNNIFSNVDDAIKFILEQPLVANFGGYDPEKMTDDEIMEFAEDVSRMIEMLGKKYNK